MKISNIKNIAVFCGGNSGNNLIYRQEAEHFAQLMLAKQLTLVYGGAKVGLMGIIADYMLQRGGKVIGVMPQFLVDVEIAHPNLSDFHIVKTMAERKLLLAELSDAFIALPGGPGTLDEFFEMYTLAYLGHHTKPCGVLNTHLYYGHLVKLLNHMVMESFLNEVYRNMLVIEESPQILLQRLLTYQPPVNKWSKSKISHDKEKTYVK
jgi:uncharacterized protein (TIGR00730 family)